MIHLHEVRETYIYFFPSLAMVFAASMTNTVTRLLSVVA